MWTTAKVCALSRNQPINWQTGDWSVRYLYGQEADVSDRCKASMLSTKLDTGSAVADQQCQGRTRSNLMVASNSITKLWQRKAHCQLRSTKFRPQSNYRDKTQCCMFTDETNTIACKVSIGLFLTYRTDSTDYLTISGFTSLNGLICLHSVLDKAGSQSVFKRT